MGVLLYISSSWANNNEVCRVGAIYYCSPLCAIVAASFSRIAPEKYIKHACQQLRRDAFVASMASTPSMHRFFAMTLDHMGHETWGRARDRYHCRLSYSSFCRSARKTRLLRHNNARQWFIVAHNRLALSAPAVGGRFVCSVNVGGSHQIFDYPGPDLFAINDPLGS